MLKRLAVAGLGMMQVMMFAVAMYAGDMHGMDAGDPRLSAHRQHAGCDAGDVVRRLAVLRGRAQPLRTRSVTMDVPVSARPAARVWRERDQHLAASRRGLFRFGHDVHLLSERGALCGDDCAPSQRRGHRFAEPAVAGDRAPRGGRRDGDVLRTCRWAARGRGDRLLVRSRGGRAGRRGRSCAGRTRVDESMLTGESMPVPRAAGDRLAAGTINVDAPRAAARHGGRAATVLASIVALLNRAQAERPRITRAADRTASRFLARVLVGAAAGRVFWSFVDPARAFAATLAVLVVACPCALSLATLVAVASANAALARRGVLVTHADAVEGLAGPRASCSTRPAR